MAVEEGPERGGAEHNLGTRDALLMHTQVDEAGGREKRLDVAKKAKRSPIPCRDPARKRFRFNSESG